jgi:hypothetical protein
MYGLSKEEHEEYVARYDTEVNAMVLANMDAWKGMYTEKRKIVRAKLRKELESKLRDKVRAMFKKAA